jgi:hypothetical protein
MVRGSIEPQSLETKISETIDYQKLLHITDEAEYSARMTEWLLRTFPQKKIVVDAGALQMMDLAWMEHREVPAILTPHRIEFERLFHISLDGKNHDEIAEQCPRTGTNSSKCHFVKNRVLISFRMESELRLSPEEIVDLPKGVREMFLLGLHLG